MSLGQYEFDYDDAHWTVQTRGANITLGTLKAQSSESLTRTEELEHYVESVLRDGTSVPIEDTPVTILASAVQEMFKDVWRPLAPTPTGADTAKTE